MCEATTGAGYEVDIGRWTLAPSVSLQYVRLYTGSYTESGAGALDLNVDSQTVDSLQGSFGGRIYYKRELYGSLVMPSFRISYGHEFARGIQSVTSRLAQGSSPFTIDIPSPDRNFLNLGAGITVITSGGASLYLSYDAQIGADKYLSHSLNGGLRVRF